MSIKWPEHVFDIALGVVLALSSAALFSRYLQRAGRCSLNIYSLIVSGHRCRHRAVDLSLPLRAGAP
ncbi:hypothetical protein VXQ18_09550 [Brucella abortus]|nr:hypothetical protein [Brucella abortus]